MEPPVCRTVAEGSNEIVIYEGAAAGASHKELFQLADSHYFPAGPDIVQSLSSCVTDDLAKLHVAAGWETILRVALWTSRRPLIHDVLALLKKTGIAEAELSPFRTADINDLFPWLYYGKRFEVLRKICNKAKARAEAGLEKKMLLVYCHLVSDETGRIVASSL
ncbi:MAG: hypothetical protein ACYC69_01200 [Thermodesulfovibrionales bacterium]